MTAKSRLEIDVSVAGDLDEPTATVRLTGEFDRLQVARFDRIVGGLHDDVADVTVDLTATSLIDSVALGALIRLRRSLTSSRFRVLVTTPFQVTVMQVTGLDDFLSVQRV